MPTYVHDGSMWQELTGTDRPSVHAGGSFQGVDEIYVHNGVGWQQAYQFDNTGPSIADFTVVGNDSNQMTINWSGGAFVTDASSGVASVQIQYQYTPFGGSGEGWNAWQNWTGGEWTASSGSYGFTVSTAKRATQGAGAPGFYVIQNLYYVDFRVIATDNAGNVTTKTMANGQLTRPYGTFLLVPPYDSANGRTYGDSYSLTQNPDTFVGLGQPSIRSGNGTLVGSQDWDYGCWFYGNEVETYHLYRDAAGNRYKADSGTLYIQRYQSSGTSGPWAFQQHNLTFSNGATGASFLGNILVASPNISGNDADRTFTLDSGHLTNFSNLSAKGFGMVRNLSSSYRVCRNYLQDLSASGTITLVFN